MSVSIGWLGGYTQEELVGTGSEWKYHIEVLPSLPSPWHFPGEGFAFDGIRAGFVCKLYVSPKTKKGRAKDRLDHNGTQQRQRGTASGSTIK